MNYILSGAYGRMGRVIAEKAAANGDTVLFGVDPGKGQAAFPVYADFADAPAVEEAMIIDFSVPATLDALLAYAVKNHVPAVLATTGYTAEQIAQVDEAAKEIPIFRSANMSLGIALLQSLCREAAKVLGEDYDVEIVETHHNRKVDAPSGTALMIYDAVKDTYAEAREIQCGRSGRDSKRKHQEIGMHSLRGGTVCGEHEVRFLGPYERFVITHSAEDRSLFGNGALRAAAYLSNLGPGLYTMDDLVKSI